MGIRIRNQIRMFLGLLDPDTLVRCMDPNPAPDLYLFFINVLSGLNQIMPAKQNLNTKFLQKIKFFRLKIICL